MAVLTLKQWFSLKFMQCASIISFESFWKICLHRWINLEFLIIAESSKDVNPGFYSKRQPTYLAPFAITLSLSSDKAGKKRGKKGKKGKRKSKQTSSRCMLNDLEFSELGSSTHAGDYDSEKKGAVSGNKTGGSSTVKLSHPSSADESTDDWMVINQLVGFQVSSNIIA